MRVVALFLISVLVLAACDEAGSGSPPTGTTSPTVSQPTSTSTPSPTPERTLSPTGTEVLPTSTPDIRATLVTLFSTPFDTCVEAVDIELESVQIWLDAIDGLSDEVVFYEAEGPPEYEELFSGIDELAEEFEDRAAEIGCDSNELDMLLVSRFGELEANNPTAERVLEVWGQLSASMLPTPTAPPTPTFPPIELNWNVESCEAAADLFIDLTQKMLYGVVDLSVGDLSSDNPPQAVSAFEDGMSRLVDISRQLGCEDEEIHALIEERVDRLEAPGHMGELLLESLKDAIEGRRLIRESGDEAGS